MEFLSDPLTREQSDSLIDRIEIHFQDNGFGFWAIEVPGVAPFVGFVGLSHTRFEAAFTPCVEVGWRLAFDHWGNGYASEGAKAAIQAGFTMLGLREIVSYTVTNNIRSRRVMERIGMDHVSGGDFEHPALPPGHPLRMHVLYHINSSGI